MNYDTSLRIGTHEIALDAPTYFIADIAANHDGDLERAKDLIWKSKEAGADCAKFQHFVAGKIVSKVGFEGQKGQVSHQAKWKKSVVEVYDQYHTRRDWTDELIETCRKADIHFMTTPYDIEAVDMFRDLVPAFKIGSGDITFHEEVEHIAKVGKPVLLATGAADMKDVEDATALILCHNHPSGDPTPSSADITLTAELTRAAALLDIDLIDHLIVGDGRWVSLRRLGLGFAVGR